MTVITRMIKFLRVGVGISDTDVEYAESTSQTIAPTEGWQTTAPKWRKGYYIWSRTHIYYTDGNEKVSTPMCLSVARSIDSIEECYYSSTSSSAITGGAWVKGKSPKWVNGRYIWTKSIIHYSDGTSAETNPVCCSGGQGPQGPQGEVGATLRGPQSWENCGPGYHFESGATGEEWKDVVVYGSGTYSCIKTHDKSADNFPGSEEDINNGYWRAGSPIELLIAKIILTQYQLVDNLGVKVIEMRDGDNNIVFLAKDGNVICNSGTFKNITVAGNSTFSGTMKAVSGSFKNLNCVDDNGNIVGSIQFNTDGRMEFAGDLFNQGYNNKKERGYRFYSADIWCRGMFGHRQKTMAVVKGGYMMVYTRGVNKTGVYVELKTGTTSNNKTFRYIPLYSPGDGDASGMPIDVVVFNTISDYYYAFSDMGNGKEWKVINGNDKQTIHFCDNGGWHSLGGGSSVNCVYVNPEWLNPVPNINDIGRGVFLAGETDLNWA